jgi:hypothetical protein
MKLSDVDVMEFQQIWKDIFHEEISTEEARLVASDVMALYSHLAQSRVSMSPAEISKRNDEVFSLLQEIDRKRGSAGAVH